MFFYLVVCWQNHGEEQERTDRQRLIVRRLAVHLQRALYSRQVGLRPHGNGRRHRAEEGEHHHGLALARSC